MTTRPPTWVDKHLWAILGAALMGYVGLLTGQSNAAVTTEKLTAIDARIAGIEARLGKNEVRISGRTDFMTCAVRTIDRIGAALKLNPPCQLGIPD